MPNIDKLKIGHATTGYKLLFLYKTDFKNLNRDLLWKKSSYFINKICFNRDFA